MLIQRENSRSRLGRGGGGERGCFFKGQSHRIRVGKNSGLKKKNQPSGFFLVFLFFFGVFWVFLGFLGFFCPDETVFRVFFQFHEYF